MVRSATCIFLLGGILLVVGCSGTVAPDSGNGDMTGDMTGDITGDAVAGATLFSDNCMVCHGDGAAGGSIGPDIRGADAAGITDHANDAHEGHTTFGLSEQDVADIEAYLATL